MRRALELELSKVPWMTFFFVGLTLRLVSHTFTSIVITEFDEVSSSSASSLEDWILDGDLRIEDEDPSPIPVMTASSLVPVVTPTIAPEAPVLSISESAYLTSMLNLLGQQAMTPQVAQLANPVTPVYPSRQPIAFDFSNDSMILADPCRSSPHIVTPAVSISSNASCVSNSTTSDDETMPSSSTASWMQRYQELLNFQERHGHVNVPYNYPQNPPLAQWTKRQRHQKKLLEEGRHSNLTSSRLVLLEECGFIWDSRQAHWLDRFYELQEFQRERGHLKISKTKKSERPLSVWLKRQRQQARLYLDGQRDRCNMTQERLSLLVDLGVKLHRR